MGGARVTCSSSCRLDYGACSIPVCGDGVRQGSEECDLADLDRRTCSNLGYSSGTLVCGDNCFLDDSDCIGTCGDGRRNRREQCEGADLGGFTCQSFGYTYGDLVCVAPDPDLADGGCSFNTSPCFDRCGDGQIGATESCEFDPTTGMVLDDARDCWELNLEGTAKCDQSSCRLDSSQCTLPDAVETFRRPVFATATDLDPARDIDCFAFPVRETVDLTITSTVGDCSNDNDTLLRVFDDAAVLVGESNDAFLDATLGGRCSQVSVRLDPGTYHACVRAFSSRASLRNVTVTAAQTGR